ELPEGQREQLAHARHAAGPIRRTRPLLRGALDAPAGRLARMRRRSPPCRVGFRLRAGPPSPSVAHATSRARRPRAPTGTRHPALSPPFLDAAGTDGREQLVEERVEGRTVALVLHQARGERLAQDLALHAGGGDGTHGVERFGHRDLDTPAPEALHKGVDALAHPPMLAAQMVTSDRRRVIQGMNEKNVYTAASTTIDSQTSGRVSSRRSKRRKPQAFALKSSSVVPSPRVGMRFSRSGLPSDQWRRTPW